MYDVAVIGAGWAGFNAALRAKGLGLKVCLFESGQIGGTCLNRGCIPTKTLIRCAKQLSLARKSQLFGVETINPQLNFLKVLERKDGIVRQLQQGLRSLLNNVDFFNQEAEIISVNKLKSKDTVIDAGHIIIACGSRPVELGILKFDGKKIVSSDDILNLQKIPSSFLIVGGGVIGCEFASLFSEFGSSVTLVEKMPCLLPGEDKEISRKIEIIFKKKGIKINTNTDVQSLDLDKYDLILVCVGRIPDTQKLGLERLGIKLDGSKIIVDDYLRTTVPNIYAAGDCTAKTMLAHFAAYQGSIAAENAANPKKLKMADNVNIPNCIFTDPEIASVGLGEEAARNRGIDVEVRKLDFLSSGMARIIGETEGFIKIIFDSKSKELLGASIIGPGATELIAVLTLAVSLHLKVSQISEVIFAHPTLSECIAAVLKANHAA